MTKRPEAPAIVEDDDAAARIAVLEARVAELTAQLASRGTSEERSRAAQEAHRQLEAKLPTNLRPPSADLEEFRAVVETSREGILFGDPTGNILYRSPSYGRINGFSDEERVGRSGFETVHPDDARALRERWVDAVARPGSIESVQYRIRHKDGSYRWIESTIQNSLEHPDLGVMVIAARDITERKRTEEALRESEVRFATAFELNPNIMSITDVDDGVRFVAVNGAFEQALGYRRDEVIGRTLGELGMFADAEKLEETRRLLLVEGQLRAFELELVRKDGSVRTGLMSAAVVTINGRTCAVATIIDITEHERVRVERARLEEQLQQARKMEAIGTLAGGVAHDFNNILGGVLAGLSLLELELGDAAAKHRADFREMEALVTRGGELTKQLLGLGRRGKLEVRPIDLADVARSTCAMFNRSRSDLTIEYVFPHDLPAVLMDHAQLEQALLNLALNAGRAMPRGGRLRLSAESVTLSDADAAPHGIRPGQFVKLLVSDTGTGMDAATMARVFEPFFTTKVPGQGSGLGLASVYGIVKNHGGLIAVDSKLGEGTTFTIVLPATDDPVSRRSPPLSRPRPGNGTILLVDDEPSLLDLLARRLRPLGYEVLAAPGGRAAVELAREHGDRLSLVMLDMTMPDLSGAATYDAIRAIAPFVKVLLVSGFAPEGQAEELLARGCTDFLQKPFSMATLTAKLRELL